MTRDQWIGKVRETLTTWLVWGRKQEGGPPYNLKVLTTDLLGTTFLGPDAPLPSIYVVFDGPPGPEGPRFVEVEDSGGRSISIGEWVTRPDGLWALRIPDPRIHRPGTPEKPGKGA